MTTNEFGMTRQKHVIEKYIGEYVYLYYPQQSFGGRVKEVKDGWVTLNPFQGAIWDPEKGLTRKLIDKDSGVSMMGIIGIEPTTKESIEGYCEYSNKHQNSR